MDADPGSAVPLAEQKLPFQNSLAHLAASFPQPLSTCGRGTEGRRGYGLLLIFL